MQYVGQTKNRLMDRFQAHFQTVQSKNQQYDISRHFNKKDHNSTYDFIITILDFIYAGPNTEMASSLHDIGSTGSELPSQWA